MHRKRARGGFWEIWEKSVELSLAVRRRVTFASSQWPCGGCHTCWWGRRWKSQHRKIVPLSPYVEEPLNSRVIKSFVPELRSRYVFFVFRDSYVLFIYVMNILCTFHTYPDIWQCYNMRNIRGLRVKALNCGIVVSSNFSQAITFTFGIIAPGKVWTPLFS